MFVFNLVGTLVFCVCSVLSNGDRLGFFIFDKDKTTADKSGASEYDCGHNTTSLKAPLLSISPSSQFNETALFNMTVSVSPSRTPFFGGLAQGRYKLCYCKRPDATPKNPNQECHPADYKWSAGMFFFYDVPRVRQSTSVNVDKAYSRFLFQIKSFDSVGLKQRVVIADFQTNYQTFGFSRGCGYSGLTGTVPTWSNGNPNSQTTANTPLVSVRKSFDYEEVAFHLPWHVENAPMASGLYSVCLCDITHIGLVEGDPATDCATTVLPASAPVEIATVFVHDLGFFQLPSTTTFSLAVTKTSNVPVTLTYLNPTTVFSQISVLWFARSSGACGNGSHTAGSATMTLAQSMPASQSPTTVDFSQVGYSSLLDPYRVCLRLISNSVVDLNNVVVAVSDVTISFDAATLADKISDNNQMGITPMLTTAITGSKYQEATNTPARDNGLWYSENFVTLTMTWNTSVATNNWIYAVKQGFPCSFYDTSASPQPRSKSFWVKNNDKTATFPLDLGPTLFNSVSITPSSNIFQTMAPAANTTVANYSLFETYSLCATCSGCDTYGYETGRRFKVLAALSVYQDVGFEKPYRFNRAQQIIYIASGATVATSASLFLASDRVFFADAAYPCFDYDKVGYNTNSSSAVNGNTTVHLTQTSSQINAFGYMFDFSPIPNIKADGRLFKLCVVRSGEIFDFPGCAVGVIRVTTAPATAAVVYGGQPDITTTQSWVLSSVATYPNFNQIKWKFTGTIKSLDRLSISSIASGSSASAECKVSAYSYNTFLASQTGESLSSPATSAKISGMIPGQYALCYCSVVQTPTNLDACRTARDFAQFVGYVYFDGSYKDFEYVNTWGVTTQRPSNLQLKMTQGSFMDRIMLISTTQSCGTGDSRDSTLTTKAMSNPWATLSPTTAAPTLAANPTANPTKAPITSSPTGKPTTVPTSAPTTRSPVVPNYHIGSGRRRRLLTTAPTTNGPTFIPTVAPTRAPITSAPSTKFPTRAPVTTAPTRAPVTSAPTTVHPTYLGKETRSPTQAFAATAPYVTMSLATPYTFNLAGQFKVCYCWSSRSKFDELVATATHTNAFTFPTSAPTTSAPTSAPTTSAPTSAPTTRGPTTVTGRRLTATTSKTVTDSSNKTTATSCLGTGYLFQQRFGVEVGTLLVHDLYFVSFKTNSGFTKTQRLAVRAVPTQVLRFSASQTVFQVGNNAWFAKHGSTCSSPGVASKSSGSSSNFGLQVSASSFSAQFDFSVSGLSRTCSTQTRRTNGYQSLESEFFYRLCLLESGVYRDFANLFVTVTDITIVEGYHNPVLTAATQLYFDMKFKESCGFLWNEMNWQTPSHIRFVSSAYPCEHDYTTGSSYSSVSQDYTNRIEYTMYDGSLIKYFLDDTNYHSRITFGDVPHYRVAFRMCLYVQSSLYDVAGQVYNWIDYPDVAVYPVSVRVTMTVKDSKYLSTTATDCPLGTLGCKCTNAISCGTGRYIAISKTARFSDVQNFITPQVAICKTELNLCVVPSPVLFGQLNRTKFCSITQPCHNPGPIQGSSSVFIYLEFTSNELISVDNIIFTKVDVPCGSTTFVSAQITNLITSSLISLNTGPLSSNYRYRMCVLTQQGEYLDYAATVFTIGTGNTGAPSSITLKPTQWYNKGNSITYSPTLTNPDFWKLNNGVPFGPAHANLGAFKVNALQITTEGGGSALGLYTQWTNFTQFDVKAADTLRVYRSVLGGLTAELRTSPVGASQICTPEWANSQSAEPHDLVMEVKVTQTSTDVVQSSVSVAASVSFPALPKGYYTACFCRKTESGRCQMTPAGMIYSSAARMVSAAGSGAKGSTFSITPLLDYEVNTALFASNAGTGGVPFIKASDFCLSTAAASCSSCVPTEFTIATDLTKGFPLTITNVIGHAVGTSDVKVYNLCFRDPILKQFHTEVSGSTMVANTADSTNTANWMKWNYGNIGTVYLTDLTFQWEQNGGLTLPRTSYSLASQTDTMMKFQYTGNTDTLQAGDTFWFTNLNYACSVMTSINGVSTPSAPVPSRNTDTNAVFRTVVAGTFFRLCVRPAAASTVYRDFGVSFGAWVTDVNPSATTFKFFNSFQVSLDSKMSLVQGDEFFLLHVAKPDCSSVSSVVVGWVSPNKGVYNNSLVHNMGKMAQVTQDETFKSNIPLGYAGYRLCVARTSASGAVKFIDYAGVIFTPEGSNHIVWSSLPKAGKAPVRILSGLPRDVQGTYAYIIKPSFTVQSGDTVWFHRSDRSCAVNIWSPGASSVTFLSSQGHSYGSSRVTLADSNFDLLLGQYVEFNPDFSSTVDSVTPVTYRMCVTRASWTKDASGATMLVPQTIVQDYNDVTVSVSSKVTFGSSSPTSFWQLANQPTPQPATVPKTNDQVVTVYSSSQSNSVTWTFTGTVGVDPAVDKLAIVTYTPNVQNCDGSTYFASPILLIPAAQGPTVITTGTATTAVFSSVAPGKYFICYCRASASVTGNCDSELAWRQTIGYLYSIGVVPTDIYVSKIPTSASAVTVWFNQAVNTDMRFSLVGASDKCGVSQPLASTVAPVLHYNSPSALAETTVSSSMMSGLSTSQFFSTSTVGVYQLCLCLTNCVGLVSNFGGAVGTLLIHDILINGQQLALILPKTNTVVSAPLTITQTLFKANETVWFSLNSCGKGDHVANENTTEVTKMPVSGGSVTVNYTLMRPSMSIYQMCVKVATSSKVYTFSNLGFIVTDVILDNLSSAPRANVQLTLTYVTGLRPSPTSTEFFFFRDSSKTCDGACGTGSSCTITSDEYTSDGKEIPTSGVASSMDFSKFNQNGLSIYRLCVVKNTSATAPWDFIDFNTIRIYPISSDVDFLVENGAVLAQNQYQVNFKVPQSVQFFRNTDQLYFRRSDLACLAAAPASGDSSTSGVFFYKSSTVAMSSDFGTVNPTNSSWRLCAQTTTGLTLDYSTKKVYVTNVQVSTKFCAPSSGACTVSISVQAPEGYFSNVPYGNTVQIWFQRITAPFSPCSTGRSASGPAQSEVDASRTAFYLSTATSVDVDFSQTVSSLTAPLRLCAYNSHLSRFADFPSVQLFALNVRLSGKTQYDTSVARSQYLASTDRLVHITADIVSMPFGSVTWFQSTAQSCSKPSVASATSTSTATTNADVTNGVALSYDFSQVLPFGAQQIPLRLCYTAPGVATVTDANSVVVYVVKYTVTPAFVAQAAAQQVSLFPGSEVGISYFTFCRSDTVCPVYSSMSDVSTVNCSSKGVYYVGSLGLFDFTNVQSNGMLLKLCGARLNYDSPFDVADLAPVGVYGGSLSIDRSVVQATSTNTAVKITWSVVFDAVNNSTYTNTDVVWFQSAGAPCSTASQTDATKSSNSVAIKTSPFDVSFDFSKITGASVRMCASVGGAVRDFSSAAITLMTATLGASSVQPAAGQSFTVTYSSVAALSGHVNAYLSTDASCANTAAGVSTPAVASVSGTVHTFDFSGAAASNKKWVLCLQGSATLSVDFAPFLVVDVGPLGTAEVNKAAAQQLTLTSAISLVANDTVWFSASGCAAAKQVGAVTFTGPNSYSFDFSGVAPDLTSVWSMCVNNAARGTLSYTSSSVKVVPSADLSKSGPYMMGSRAVSFNSETSPFLAGSQIAFSSTDCIGATYVASTATTYNFSPAGTYSLCVKQSSGVVTKVTSVSVVIQSCSDICPASRAAGCDVVQGTCTNCTAHFSGDRCQTCAAGYSGGADCDSCDSAKNYQCSIQGAIAGACASPNTCAVCQCNGHFDAAASARCPSNVCACAVGYNGAACESCQTGFWKVGTNTSSAFTCNSCADKCFKHASSCTADLCQCTGNFDPAKNCEFCMSGYILNATSGSCAATLAPTTSSPTAAPTSSPSSPTNSPTAAPVDPCTTTVDVDTSGDCAGWDQSGYCATTEFTAFMGLNCAKTCLHCTSGTASDSPAYARACPAMVEAGYCYSLYASFMETNCIGSCEAALAAREATNSGCSTRKDSIVYARKCSGWKAAGYCTSNSVYYGFLIANCAGTCCGSSNSSGVNTCADLATYSSSCGSWAALGHCTNAAYSGFMTNNCKYSCGDCGDNSAYVASCARWKIDGYCVSVSQYYGFMQTNCKTTCAGF